MENENIRDLAWLQVQVTDMIVVKHREKYEQLGFCPLQT